MKEMLNSVQSAVKWLWSKGTPQSAGDVAKQRLQLLLVQDRVQLEPEQMNALKRDLLAVLSKYVEIDESALEIELQQLPETRKMALVSNIPVKRVLAEEPTGAA
jgi:cell division topological specificity factor